MRILIFNGYYLPSKNYGGPQTSIQNLINSCGDIHDFFVVCNNHDFNSSRKFDVPLRTIVKVERASVIYLNDHDLDYSVYGMLSFLRELKPDIIWFSGVLVPKKKVVGALAAKKLHIPLLFSPRGEVNADHIRIKAWKKKPFLYLLRFTKVYHDAYFHSTCSDETDGIINYFKPKRNHLFVVPNIAMPKQGELIKHNKKPGTLSCIFISRIHPVKNLLYAIKVLSKCKSQIIYDIYGPIEDQSYWQNCIKEMSLLSSNITINYKGFLPRENLPMIIQEHDCLLFLSKNENYSHTIAETLSNKRPVIIGLGATPWDSVNNVAGYTVPLDNYEIAAKKIDELAAMDESAFEIMLKRIDDFYNSTPLISSAIAGHLKMFNDIQTDYWKQKK